MLDINLHEKDIMDDNVIILPTNDFNSINESTDNLCGTSINDLINKKVKNKYKIY